MTVYYPSAQVRLQIRIDDYTDEEQLADQLQRPTAAGGYNVKNNATREGRADSLRRNQEAQKSLNASRANTSQNEYSAQKALLDAQRKKLQTESLPGQVISAQLPGAVDGSELDEQNIILSTLPISGTIERNNIQDPDTCQITLDFRDVPVDPRIVRSCLVVFTIGAVDAGDYKDGVVNRETRLSDNLPTSIVERTVGEETRFAGGSSRFVGFVDEWTIEFSEDGDKLELNCRDVTALLKDERLPAGVGIDLTKPIIEGVRDLIERKDDFGKQLFPGAVGLNVFFGTPEQLQARGFVSGGEDLGPVPQDSVSDAHKSRGGKKSKAQRNGDKKDSVWDHIVTTCQKLGLIPFMRNFVLFITEPQTLYSQIENGRKMVYGRNLSELKFARKMGGVRADTIEIRSFDPDIGRSRWARYPVLKNEPSSGILGDPKSDQPVVSRPGKVSPTGTPQESVQVYQIPRINDLKLLENVARQTFEEIARQEIEGSFSTEDMDSFKLEADETKLPEFDLLTLQAGEPITILVAPSDDVAQGDSFQQTPKAGKQSSSSAQEINSFTASRRKQYLKSLGLSEEKAQRLALAAEQIPLANTFKAAYVNINYDVEDGVGIECSFYNYITVRENPRGT